MDLKTKLQQIISGEMVDDIDSLEFYSKDASIFKITPRLIISPKDTDDLKKIVKFINNNPKENLSLTPRAAGTCMSGGAINDSIILDMTKHFDKIISVTEFQAITQPGVFYRDFEKETLKKNALLPCYTSSRELNTVGGMVGNNSAGEKTLTFGQTEKYVKKLKVILSDGNEYIFEPLTKTQLDKKIAQKDFEGKLYQEIYKLIEENYQKIQQSKPQTSKNSTGYALWNVWDSKTQVFDMTKLITGSQGTLGIVSEIAFSLVKPNLQTAMLEIELDSISQLDKVVNDVLQYKPESFECFDDATIRFALKYISDIEKDFKKIHGLAVYAKFIPEFISQLLLRLPKLVLIAEFTGEHEDEVLNKAQAAQESLQKFPFAKTRVVRSNDEEKYWILRRDSFNILRHHSGENLRTAPFIDDIIVNPKELPEFLPKLQNILKPYKDKIIYTLAGHIGNGNFHIIPLMNLNNKEIIDLIPEISKKVFDLVFEYNGSMAAEHNDGLVRGPYLPKMYGEDIYNLFKKVKEIFDPHNIFNPHKKTDATFEYSYSHISQNTGVNVKDYQAEK